MDNRRQDRDSAPCRVPLSVAPSVCVTHCCLLSNTPLPLQLVREGRTVVVAARSADKAAEVFSEAGLREGYQVPAEEGSSSSSASSSGILITEAGVDVTNPETLTKQLFEGVTQVCVCVWMVAGGWWGAVLLLQRTGGKELCLRAFESQYKKQAAAEPQHCHSVLCQTCA